MLLSRKQIQSDRPQKDKKTKNTCYPQSYTYTSLCYTSVHTYDKQEEKEKENEK
jgi:hypothetical protein